jgi:hypothetical protein
LADTSALVARREDALEGVYKECLALGLAVDRIVKITADITEVADLVKVRDAVVKGESETSLSDNRRHLTVERLASRIGCKRHLVESLTHSQPGAASTRCTSSPECPLRARSCASRAWTSSRTRQTRPAARA